MINKMYRFSFHIFFGYEVIQVGVGNYWKVLEETVFIKKPVGISFWYIGSTGTHAVFPVYFTAYVSIRAATSLFWPGWFVFSFCHFLPCA